MFDIEDYRYDLPEELIAQEPASRRDDSRLFFVRRDRGAFSDHRFTDLPSLLIPGDLLVLNDTKVVPARLYGRKESGGRVELLILDHPKKRGCGYADTPLPAEGIQTRPARCPHPSGKRADRDGGRGGGGRCGPHGFFRDRGP